MHDKPSLPCAPSSRRGRGAVAAVGRFFRVLPSMLAVLATALAPVASAKADVGKSMEGYFDSMGAAANVNGPTAYEGQRAGYYSAGSIYARFPQKTINPVNIQLPSYRAGCGGIDIFAGSFSFVNAAELVAMMKAVANNAVGFAFKLAVDTLCPECGATMSDLSQRVQQMNNQMLNSCQLAQGLVGAATGKSDMLERSFCEMIAPLKGAAKDAAAAANQCGNAGEREKVMAVAKADAETADVTPGPINLTWQSLKSAPMFGDGKKITDPELAQLAMTLVGTVIRVPSGATVTGSFKVDPPDPTVGRMLLDGAAAKIKVRKCDELVECLNPQPGEITAPSKGLKERVKALIEAMTAAVVTDVPLSEPQLSQTKSLLQVASIPLYKVVAVNAAYGRGMPNGDRDMLAEIVAVDLLYDILKNISDEALKGQVNLSKVESGDVQLWAANVERARSTLADQRRASQAKVQEVMAIVQRTQFIEGLLQSKMSPALNATYDWSRAASMSSMR